MGGSFFLNLSLNFFVKKISDNLQSVCDQNHLVGYMRPPITAPSKYNYISDLFRYKILNPGTGVQCFGKKIPKIKSRSLRRYWSVQGYCLAKKNMETIRTPSELSLI